MTNKHNVVLSSLFRLGLVFAFAGCIEPVIIGGNGNGGNGGNGSGNMGMGNQGNTGTTACMTDSDCANGQACINGMCDGDPPLQTCNGVPSPLSCTQTGCPSGQICAPDLDPNSCYPSACGCDAMGGWVCTADCGQGSHCVVPQQCGSNGMCPAGTTCDATTGLCVAVCAPGPEICNGIDDNCNGAVDEQSDPAFPLCADGSMCVMGQCGGTSNVCRADSDCFPGQICINGMCVNSMCNPEICNGFDDDCDGNIDNQSDPALPLCPDGSMCVMGQCTGGTNICMVDSDCFQGQICVNGACVNSMCRTEICNGLDDDCNNVIDDGPGSVCADGTMCINGTCGGTTQQCGPNSPPCPPGQMCSSMGVCVGSCMASPETCNGIDDDCDGAVDDTPAGTTLCPNGTTCVNGTCGGTNTQCGPMRPCPTGQMCTATGICVTTGCMPAPETCNGRDDDCNGVIDDAAPGTILCPNGGQCVNGACSGTTTQCGPMVPCPPGQTCTTTGTCVTTGCQPVAEVCNGIDDDCDGTVDDATPGTTLCQNGICLGGQCRIPCNSTNNCPMGTMCVNGVCQ
ncbi:MAG TPA: MopE-related protein [Polyangium sp.]|nr:MopE-related protein [Polyangium sp.]